MPYVSHIKSLLGKHICRKTRLESLSWFAAASECIGLTAYGKQYVELFSFGDFQWRDCFANDLPKLLKKNEKLLLSDFQHRMLFDEILPSGPDCFFHTVDHYCDISDDPPHCFLIFQPKSTFDPITSLFEFFVYVDGLISSLCYQWHLFPRNLRLSV